MRLLNNFLPFNYLPYMKAEGIFALYEQNQIPFSYDISPIKARKSHLIFGITARNLRQK